jgi:hypothetical protein
MIEILVKNSENKVEVPNNNFLEIVLWDKYKELQSTLNELVGNINAKPGKWLFNKGVDEKLLYEYNYSLDILINKYVENVRWSLDGDLILPIREIIKNWPKKEPEVKSELETKVKAPEQEQKPNKKVPSNEDSSLNMIASNENPQERLIRLVWWTPIWDVASAYRGGM